jgi:hypothetical protein
MDSSGVATFTTLTAGQEYVAYSSSNGRKVEFKVNAPEGVLLSDAADVDVSTLTDGQVLKWDASGLSWRPLSVVSTTQENVVVAAINNALSASGARDAIRAACDQAITNLANGYGAQTVLIPMGCDVDTTTGACGAFVAQQDITIRATATGKVAGGNGVRIRRTAGSNPVFTWTGTGTSGTTRAYGGMRDIEVSGNNTGTTYLVAVERVNEFVLDRVRLSDSPGGALHAIQPWNCNWGHLEIYKSGNGTATPALKIEGETGESSVDTLLIANLQCELNTGTDIQITGDTSSASYAGNVTIGNLKTERGGSGQAAGLAMSWPVFDLVHCNQLQIGNWRGALYTPTGGGSNTSRFLQGGAAAASTLKSIQCSNADLATDGSPDYFLVFQGGNTFQFSNLKTTGTPTTKYIKIDSALGVGSVALPGYRPGTVALAGEDNRTSGNGQATSIFRGEIPLVPQVVSGGATLVNDSGFPAVEFADGSTGDAFYSVRLPHDAYTGSDLKVTALLEFGVNTGNARLVCIGRAPLRPSTGTVATATASTITSDVTAPGTAGQCRVNDFDVTVAAGDKDTVGIQFERLGAHANDTTTGVVRVLALILTYDKKL